MINDPSKEYYSFGEVVELTGWPERTARRRLGDVPAELVRHIQIGGRGRPMMMYHFSCHSEILARHDERRRRLNSPAPKEPIALDPADLQIAALRMRAVMDYRARMYEMSEAQSAAVTVADWTRRPRSEALYIKERIGRRAPTMTRQVQVGGFSESTLRAWSRALDAGNGDLTALAPRKKGRSGRTRKEIPENLLDFVHGLSKSTGRSEVREAIRVAKQKYPGDWPEVSDSTIERRIRERDPHKRADSLGKGSVSRFELEQVPDIERDWRDLSFNQLWTLDDWTEDWYAVATEIERVLRPYAYGIQRVSTRQWIYGLVSPVPITQEQVRTIVGLAMASSACGIPDEITFERGSVACDEYLEQQLNLLGVRVHRTRMDGGSVHPGAVADRAKGHFQGKATIERRIQEVHRRHQFEASNVGPNERLTAPARVETMKRLAAEAMRDGKPIMVPTWNEVQAKFFGALEACNDRPCSGLPDTIDAQTGEVRAMSPNEYAMTLRDQDIRVMDSAALPLFFEKAVQVPVTKNGIKLHNNWYGRFDEGLHDLTTATAYALKEIPDICFVVELGRCVERYEKAPYGAESDQQAAQGHLRKKYRNQYEELVARYQESAAGIIDASRTMHNPTPDRSTRIEIPAAVRERVTAMQVGISGHRDRREALDRRFDPEASDLVPAGRSGRRGIMARADDLQEQLAVLNGDSSQEEDPFAEL